MQTWFVDGQPSVAIGLDDRGLAYGDGLFETIALREAKPRFFDRHMRRLTEGCRRLAIATPSPEVIAADIAKACNVHARGTIKVIITRGSGPRGYGWRDGMRPTRIVGFDPDMGARSSLRADGVPVAHCRTRASSNASLAGMKTLNRLDNVLARGELREGGCDEGVMFDGNDRAVGGTMTNLFAVRDGRLLTPALDGAGVRGIMREIVIEGAAGLGIECSETVVTRDDLARAEEMFLTNALIGLWPVSSCGGVEYRVGAVTRSITAELCRRGVEECRE